MKEVNKNRKDEVLSHHSDVNIDEIWAAIEPQVDLINAEKKRKKRFFIFFLLGAMLLASGGLYMWQNGANKVEVSTTNNTGIKNTNKVELNSVETLIPETQEASLKELTKNIQNTANQIIRSAKTEIQDEVAQSKTDSAIETKSVNNSNKNTVQKVETLRTLVLNNTSKVYTKDDNSTQQISTDGNIFSDKEVTTTEESPIAKIPNPKPLIPIIPSPLVSTINNQLPSLIPEVGEVKILEQKKGEDDADNEGNLPGGKLSFALAANTGISFINRGLAANTEREASTGVLKLRRESETLLEAIHYGLRGKLTHKSGFSISTGAQYTILSERYDNNKLITESDSIQGIIKRVIQLNGDTLDIAGWVPRTTSYKYEKEIFNRYKMIDVPFIVGFEGGMKKWSLGIQAGVFVNLALKTSGQVRSSETEDLDIGDNQTDTFKSKVGLSYYGGIYIRRALSPNLDITIAPHGRFFAQDFNVSSYDIKQRYSLIGVQAGLSYRFGY